MKIEEIEREIDEFPIKEHKGRSHKRPRTIRILGRTLPLTPLALMVLLAAGILIITMLSTYLVTIQYDQNLEGIEQPTRIWYDGTELTQAETIINTPDVDPLVAGDDLIFNHLIENQATTPWKCIIDAPELITDTENEYYGYSFTVEDNGVPITDFILPPGEDKTIQYHYELSSFFLDTSNSYDFHLGLTFTEPDYFRFGVRLNFVDVDAAQIWMYNQDGFLYKYQNYDETETYLTIDYPSDETEWDVLFSDIQSTIWNDALGTRYDGNPTNTYRALVNDEITLGAYMDYTVSMNIGFNTKDTQGGVICHWVDDNNYWYFSINRHGSPPGAYIYQIVDGVETEINHVSWDISPNNPYNIKCKVSMTNNQIEMYIGGTLVTTVDI